jgi:hypothetical protein
MRILGTIALAIALSAGALAADLPTKATTSKNPFGSGYPTTKCGLYYGIGTGGSAGAMNGEVVGSQIVQGEIDALLGYTCPFGQAGFWFAEGSVGMNNVNGSVNGLAMSGPLIVMQRVGAGSPINSLFGSSPILGNLSIPSLPALPNGVTTGPANGYFFAGVVEQDITPQVAPGQSGRVWIIAPMIGVGLLTRLSDNVVVDTWAGWQMNSQSFCINNGCGKEGNTGRVGVSFKF